MKKSVPAILALILLVLPVKLALAGLSGPPPSYVIPIENGTHIVVMISPTPQLDKECTLPGGQRVSLRDTFPSSGLYKTGSTEPLWKADWYGEKGLTRISADGRFAVRVNRFGGGGHGEGVKPRWGIKFYDRGVEIKSYDVVELVDYPSLMEFTNVDWHCLWIDWSVYDAKVESGFYTLRTSTHETYRFDVATGMIVEERRVWRHVARGSLFLLAVIGLVSSWLWYRRRKTVSSHVVNEIPAPEDVDEPRTTVNRLAFRLRSLFIVTTAAAICFAFPHVAVLLSALGVAVFCTLKLSIKRRLRFWGLIVHPASQSRRWWWWALNLFSWMLFYVLSFGPAWGATFYFDLPTDVRLALLQVVYAPVDWLFTHTSLRDAWLIDLYIRAWGGY